MINFCHYISVFHYIIMIVISCCDNAEVEYIDLRQSGASRHMGCNEEKNLQRKSDATTAITATLLLVYP